MEYDEKKLDIIRGEVVPAFIKVKYHISPASYGIVFKMLTALGGIGVFIKYVNAFGKTTHALISHTSKELRIKPYILSQLLLNKQTS